MLHTAYRNRMYRIFRAPIQALCPHLTESAPDEKQTDLHVFKSCNIAHALALTIDPQPSPVYIFLRRRVRNGRGDDGSTVSHRRLSFMMALI
jgi:hypothetical protein